MDELFCFLLIFCLFLLLLLFDLFWVFFFHFPIWPHDSYLFSVPSRLPVRVNSLKVKLLHHHLVLLTIDSSEKRAIYEEEGSYGVVSPTSLIPRVPRVTLPFLKDCSWVMLSLGMSPSLAFRSAPVDILTFFF